MVKKTTKQRDEKSVKAPKPEPVEKVEEEENVESTLNSEASSSAVKASNSESDSNSDSNLDSDEEADDIKGLDVDDETSTHKIKKLETKKQSDNKQKNDRDHSGVVYVSRLPKGFHERELSKYFAQFGDLKQVRLARNKKTGNSRHYGFIEFVNKEDAKIAQETMDNYLLMGHILQVRLLPKGAKIEKLFKHKGRVFIQTEIKKSVDELKAQAKNKHELRMEKLTQSGIEFKW
ncbi:hypothetical protein HG535_0A02830 [Zygotorulaspora mrakii]|uniref:RRM domain-containing protein n=1 Tax=Zygotorulaspora mrakii TaxID=42260 RepID=A0A7H9AW79_ZYGMR|nr:uncharacterized protein HG535_0A02830 [Zygotorulaspora mrakii]QLG70344.1 hypothetical protein HG535_0A02830 [Zygotorulaspora mrakii]